MHEICLLQGVAGKVYELSMDELGIDRESVKDLMFPFIHGTIGAKPLLEEVMEMHFPKLLKLINAQKAKHYKALCYDTQPE